MKQATINIGQLLTKLTKLCSPKTFEHKAKVISVFETSVKSNDMLFIFWISIHQFLQDVEFLNSRLVPIHHLTKVSFTSVTKVIVFGPDLHGFVVTNDLDSNVFVILLRIFRFHNRTENSPS